MIDKFKIKFEFIFEIKILLCLIDGQSRTQNLKMLGTFQSRTQNLLSLSQNTRIVSFFQSKIHLNFNQYLKIMYF